MITTDPVSDGEMTEYQRQLVEQNIRLVSFAHRQYSAPAGMDSEEWQSELMFILCRAAIAFEPDRGFQFSTYFINTVRFTKKNILRWNYSIKRDIRKNVRIDKDGFDLPAGDFDPGAKLQNLEARNQYKELIKLLPIREWVQIGELKLEGYNHREIGCIMKRTKKSIGNSWLSAVEYIRKHIRAKGLEMAS